VNSLSAAALLRAFDPELAYGVLSRFDTMPSKFILQAYRKTLAPSSSVCSLNPMPSRRLPSSFANRVPA
jgi:hypothetical protein